MPELFWTTVGEIADYYGPNVLVYFAQLSGVITLFACMATIARMRRLNELTALLASGVGLHRIASPIICFGVATSMLHFVDTELFIPKVAHLLSRDHDDVGGRQTYEVFFLHDRDNVLVSAANFHDRLIRLPGGTKASAGDPVNVAAFPVPTYWVRWEGNASRRVGG